jgi:glycosyltransferase involved in cell wall biosynthesis
MIGSSITSTAAGAHTAPAPLLSYALITPARNEAAFIEATIKAVVGQTILPIKWVIVSDGSTDGTDDIAQRYAVRHDWIEVVRMPEHRDRHFAAKVSAFNAGLSRIGHLPYTVIAALDADITFDSDYFSFLLTKLAENPRLGLVGTPFAEEGVTYDYRFASVEHVSGACQVFRRQCFEEIGGYKPLKGGGIDLVAVLSSRMKGWQVRTFPDKHSHHHRKQGSAAKSGLAVILNDGKKDYLLGAHPIWEFCRAVFHTRRAPYVIGGLCLWIGYCWPMLLRRARTAPPEVVAFRRQDQKARLRSLVRRFYAPASRRPSLEEHTL